MPKRDIVVIGASAGGREALLELCKSLPYTFDGAIFIVWHMPSTGTGLLPAILNRVSKLPAENAVDGTKIEAGRIYVAPIDHHLLVDEGRVKVTKGPKENRFRPAIDPLFRSAAYVYGPRVIGIVLSGALSDGTSGLWTIKERGGITVVQDPADALVPSMPSSALENVDVDYCVPVAEMAPLLVRLIGESVETDEVPAPSERLETEVKFAKSEYVPDGRVLELGQISEFTCPECHGTLWQLSEGKILRFRCRTGHGYTAEALLEDMTESVEAMEWATVRGILESAVLMQHMSSHLSESGDAKLAQRFLDAASKAKHRAELVRQSILEDTTPHTEEGSGTAPI